jgi:hypothetical protein
MKAPHFSVLVGLAILLASACFPQAAAHGIVPDNLAREVLGQMRVVSVILTALLAAASIYRRPAAEVIALSVGLACLPPLSKHLAEQKIASTTFVPNVGFGYEVGAYLIWIGALIVALSAVLVNREAPQADQS